MKDIRLNAAQFNVMDDLRRFRLVTGPPASGKTTVALFEAHKCAEQGGRAVFMSSNAAAMTCVRQLYLELFPLHYHAYHPRSTYYAREGGSVSFVTPERKDRISGPDDLLVADGLKFSWQEWFSQIDHWRLGLVPDIGRILIVGDKDETDAARLALHHLVGWNTWGEFKLNEQFVPIPKAKRLYVATVDVRSFSSDSFRRELRERVVVGVFDGRVKAQKATEQFLGQPVKWTYSGRSAYSFDPIDFQRPDNRGPGTAGHIGVSMRFENETWDEYQERATREWEEANTASFRSANGGYVPSGGASFVPGCDYNPLSGR
jgi:hypothetical protein